MPRPSERRDFLTTSAATAAGFAGLGRLFAPPAHAAAATGTGYGALVKDPKGFLDLPKGFGYRIISRAGEKMADGFVVPGAPDGMATFPGPGGTTLIVRNHENTMGKGPFADGAGADRLDRNQIYDAGQGETPSCGGTTTIVYDTRQKKVVRQFLSLAGTIRNCAGGPTPWGSWITCEETTTRAGRHGKKNKAYHCEVDHGYNFEVPAGAKKLVDARPLKAMGRFNHEAVAVHEASGAVYQTEDRGDGLIYRFIPKKPGQLAAGGRLQALSLADHPTQDTRNWNPGEGEIKPGKPMAVRWIDLDGVESPEDDLRRRGAKDGAAVFARGEGMWHAPGEIYFACTSGGREKIGQIWRLRPAGGDGTDTLELFVEPNNSTLVHNADNLTVAPWGDLVVCEDRSGPVVRLVGITPGGKLYTLAHHHKHTEFAGATFSPDGSTLFVNVQGKGQTLAITGPWKG